MSKYTYRLKTNRGEITVEGETPDDLKRALLQLGIPAGEIEDLFHFTFDLVPSARPVTSNLIASRRPELDGIVEFGGDGAPHITIPPNQLSGSQVICLVLYAKHPDSVSLNDLAKLVSSNWKSTNVKGVSARLADVRPQIIKEGDKGSYTYRLSGYGENWVEKELLPKLRMKP